MKNTVIFSKHRYLWILWKRTVEEGRNLEIQCLRSFQKKTQPTNQRTGSTAPSSWAALSSNHTRVSLLSVPEETTICAFACRPLPDPWAGQGLLRAHHTAQQSTAARSPFAFTPTFPGSPQSPQFKKAGRKKHGDGPRPCPSPRTHQEMAKPQEHAPGSGMQEQQGKQVEKYLGSHLARQ